MIVVAGNRNYGLSKELYNKYPTAKFCSRSSGYDLTSSEGVDRFTSLCKRADIILLVSNLGGFNQTMLLDNVYKNVQNNSYIIALSSSTDRISKPGQPLYNTEKKALKERANSLSLGSVNGNGPRLTLLSVGTLENKKEQNPNKKLLTMQTIVAYIDWLISQPKEININNLSVDIIQDGR